MANASQDKPGQTMRAAVLHDLRDLRVQDVPIPAVGDDGVLVRVKAVGVCGTDLHTYKLGMFKEMTLPQEDGVLFGHEFAGEVVAIGADAGVADIAAGDRVVGFAIGAYAEYCNVTPITTPHPLVLNLPDAVSYEEAATLEPLVVSLTAVQRADPQPGERILLIGAGMIGLGCLQVIRALHPDCEVIVSDVAENRLQMAREFGAARTVNAQEEDLVAAMKALAGETPVLYSPVSSGNIDVVIECAGLPQTLNQALEVVKPASGRLIAVALYETTPQVDFNQVVAKNISIFGTLGYTEEEVRQSLQLISDGKVDRKPLITHRYDLAQAGEAFEAQINTRTTLKAVIKP
ncbi:zinc-dependent alcohol dehydrogenase [Seongchinamella sediminis]|nr:zinc-binding dehydrogenase [Seongchinamella sediminis]